LSLVVLPFRNLGGDPNDDYLADAITNDLTTDLSHVPQTFVIAHASARAIMARNVDAHQIGRELAVRYVVQGSVQRLGSVLRVNAQLVSTDTGGNLWADRYDQDTADLGSGQERLLARLRGSLGLSLVDVESERSQRERPFKPDAFDLILRARWWSNQPPSSERMRQAEDLYRRALRLDPGSIAAMTGLADTLSERNMNWAGEWLSGETLQLAETLVRDALALAPSSEAALVAQARLLHGQSRFAALSSPAQRLVELYPNNPEGYHHFARVRQFEGQFDDAVALFEKAIRLDPLEPRIFQRYGLMAFSMMQAGRYSDSASWFARSLAADPDAPPALRATRYRNMSASLALAGRLEEARRAAEEAQRLWPFDTVRSHYPLALDSPALVAHEHVFRRGLALAGVRDHADEDADFGVPPDRVLHTDLGGRTPTTAPGATTIRTGDLARMLESGARPIVLDTLTHFWGRSIPGSIGLTSAGIGGTLTDGTQERLVSTMAKLTGSDLARPIVAVGWNSERFDGYNLALRLVALGYTNVRWYRGGREAWEVAGLPESETVSQQW
jgi:TolB-like protein/Tfp pilus assembly protein PilF/rhodanese-related sulfurtransferase